MARPERFELPTYSSGGCRSIQLSYGRVVQVYIGDLGASIAAKQDQTCIDVNHCFLRRGETGTPVRPPGWREQLSTALAAAITSPLARPLGFRTRLIHINCAPAELGAIQSSDGLLALLSICHFHEAESARSSGVAIGQDTDAVYLSVGFEELPQLLF